MKNVLLLVIGIIFSTAIFAQGADDITGIWWNEAKTSKIKVEKKDGKYIGTVVFVIPEKYVDGAPAKDVKNPVANLRNRSILNLRILNGLAYDAGEKQWVNGTIYDPNAGKIYDCYAWLEGKDILQLKGYIAGIKMLGRKSAWTRTSL